MKTGDIVVVHFPFTNLVQRKVTPAVVVTVTDDKHQDFVLYFISSVVPETISRREFFLQPNDENNLKTSSVIKVQRIATIESSRVISVIGKLSRQELLQFINVFQSLPVY